MILYPRRLLTALLRGASWADGDLALVSLHDTLPKLTRRRLLATGGTSAAAAAVALNPRLAAAAAAVVADPAYLRRSSYTPLVGQRFALDSWGSSDALTLVGVSDLGGGLAGRDDAFSLRFSGDPALVIGKEAIPLRNQSLGRLELFVGHVDPVGDAHFEAIVNRSVGVTRREAPRPAPGAKQPSAPARHHHVKRTVREAAARRTPHGVRLDVAFVKGSHAKRAHGWLMLNGWVVGSFASVAVDEHRAVVKLRTDRRVPRGTYQLVIGTGGPRSELEWVPVKLR